MPKALRYILLSLSAISVVAVLYFGYLYFNGPGESGTQTDNNQSIPVKVTGIVTDASKTPFAGASNCSNQYYVQGQGHSTWLVARNRSAENWSQKFARYEHSLVEVNGHTSLQERPCSNPDTPNCGCDSYLIVDEINVIKEGGEFAQHYEGEVYCAKEGVDEEGPWCTYSLQEDGGNNYLLAPLPAVPDLTTFKGSRVRVLGIQNGTVIEVFEVVKIE